MVEPRFVDRSVRRRFAPALSLVLLAAVLAGCSDDDANAGGSTSTTSDRSSSTTTTTTAPTTTTQPPSTDQEAVEAIIADLLDRRDTLAAQLRQDPTAAAESTGPFAEYAVLFTPDSPQLRDFQESMQGVADAGHADRPGPSGVLEATHLDSMLGSGSPDVAFFQVCAFTDYETYDISSGQTVTAEAVKVVSGGEAHRVDGVWLLHDFLDPEPNLVTTLPSGTSDPCELEG